MCLLTSLTHKQCGSFTLPLTSRVEIILIHTRSIRQPQLESRYRPNYYLCKNSKLFQCTPRYHHYLIFLKHSGKMYWHGGVLRGAWDYPNLALFDLVALILQSSIYACHFSLWVSQLAIFLLLKVELFGFVHFLLFQSSVVTSSQYGAQVSVLLWCKQEKEGGGTWHLDLKGHERTGDGIHPLQMDGQDHLANCLYILCLFEGPREMLQFFMNALDKRDFQAKSKKKEKKKKKQTNKVLDFVKLEYLTKVLDFHNIKYHIAFLIEQIPRQHFLKKIQDNNATLATHLGPIWQPILSNLLSILNTLVRISTHFFIHMYIKNTQTLLPNTPLRTRVH